MVMRVAEGRFLGAVVDEELESEEAETLETTEETVERSTTDLSVASLEVSVTYYLLFSGNSSKLGVSSVSVLNSA